MRRFLRTTLSDLSYRAIRLTNGHHTGLRILTYHRVNDWHPEDLLSVPVGRFREQMEYLVANGWRVIPLTDAVEQLSKANGVTSDKLQVTSDSAPAPRPPGPPLTRAGAGTPPASQKVVVITFDDGYADNYWQAYPILREHEFPATLFVASGLMDRHEPMPRYVTGTVQHDRGLSWNEIRTMQAGGIEIGAHSMTHADLTALSLADARREIAGSKRQIEQETGRAVSAFAYPKGRLNAQVVRLVREAGFMSGCSEHVGANQPGEDLYRLRRTEISGFDTIEDFEKKLAGAYDWLHRTVQLTTR